MSKVDLHCHSSASDGILPPAEVVRRAAANGVEMLALTDHDTLGGLAEASQVATELGLRFINGVEISIEWGGSQVHVVGLNFDAGNSALNAGLAGIRSGRIDRARRMAAELEKIGLPGCFEGAMRHAENPSLISRAHFARYLVEIGVRRDSRSVFESYLVPGRPGYVAHRWASLEDAVGWVLGAGGVAAIAHPARYDFSRGELCRMFEEFKRLGGQSIEVVSGSQSSEEAVYCAKLAMEYGFLACCGSDFHDPAESNADLGMIDPLPSGLRPVWEAF